MDPILPILSILGCWAIVLRSFGGPGSSTLTPDSSLGARCLIMASLPPTEPVAGALLHQRTANTSDPFKEGKGKYKGPHRKFLVY